MSDSKELLYKELLDVIDVVLDQAYRKISELTEENLHLIAKNMRMFVVTRHETANHYTTAIDKALRSLESLKDVHHDAAVETAISILTEALKGSS